MPEGDVVWWSARRLHAALAGRPLTRCDLRVPSCATVDLTGRTVETVTARGKHLLVRVSGGTTIHTHLRMDGVWRIRPATEPVRDSHVIRAVLANDMWQAVGYRLGIVEVLPTAQESRIIGRLGPDLLGPDWDAGEAVRRLRADPTRPIGEALLDQTNLAGIGNLYKAEVLFLRGVDPRRPVGEVEDLTGLVDLARRLLEANKERVGQVTTGVRAAGQETWVYGRRGRPCRRCGGRISAADLGGRVTYWCPRCQR